jgi:putative membrane-bound dehydrogenase-like protein
MNRGKSFLLRAWTASLLPCALAFGAPPLEKSGPCPTLARYTAPSKDNWLSFPNNATGNRPPTPTSTPYPGTFPSNTLQFPLGPDSAINCVVVPAGLKAQLLASEKTPGLNSTLPLAYIMSFTFDEKGRTWAVEPRDYPYTHNDTGMPDVGGRTGERTVAGITTTDGLPADRLAGRGRILILTDVDGDGSLDNYKVFYTGLALPTSLELVKGGVIAMVPPSVYFIPFGSPNPDTAGGVPQVIVSYTDGGANGRRHTQQNYDTHGQTNSLTWGIDNFMYAHVGYNACGTITVPGAVSNPSGCDNNSIWRFKATTMGSDTNLAHVYGVGTGSTNGHGIGQSEDGQWFSSKATVTTHSHHVVRLGGQVTNILPSSYCTTVGSTSCQNHYFYPLTRDYYAWEGDTQVKWAIGGGDSAFGTRESAVSGHDFYTATLLPSKYRDYSFVCEGMTHLCNQNAMSINGSTWRATRMPGPVASNIFASSDAWSAPLKVRTGPEGALWVLDFYNYLFLHNPASPATNAAWRNALRAKQRVRLYRIVPSDGSTQPVPNLSTASATELIAALAHPNLFWRTTAQRLLLNKTYTETERNALLTQLQNILSTNRNTDTARGASPQVLHALWTVAGMRPYTFDAQPTRWDTTFKKLLLHPAWTVRRNALLAMPATVASSDAIVAQCAVNDVHPHVRIQALAKLIANPAPTTPASMVQAYRNTDGSGTAATNYANVAFNAAGASKVTEDAVNTERPSTCPAYALPVAIGPNTSARDFARRDIRFQVRDGGFVLANNLQLGSGQLSVSDLRGKVVFRSTYNASTASWSNPAARNLSLPVYFYTFREIGGASFNGRIVLNAGF